MSKLRPDERPTQEMPCVHQCKGHRLAESLLAYEAELPVGQGETLVARETWVQWVRLATEALEET